MPKNWRTRAAAVVAGTGMLAATAACSGGGGGDSLSGVEIEVAARWTGTEQTNFEQVLDLFAQETGATVTYASTGEDLGAFLGPRIEGGNPPDVAILPQPGLLAEYAEQEALQPLNEATAGVVSEHYSPYWQELGTVDGQLYGVMLKAAHKSIVWYRPEAFQAAGVTPPASWDELVDTTSATLSDAGEVPWAMCGASGWTLTDWFENVYLSQAGPENYDALVAREIPWTDDTVVAALESLAQIWGDENLLGGGTDGAISTDFPTCVTQVFGQQQGAMVYEGDFVAATVGDAGATVGDTAQVFPFPAVGDMAPVVVGGDIAVAMSDSEGAQELLQFLASPEAGTEWAGLGGYLSPNSDVAADAYPDELTQQLAQTILDAGDNVRYDLSDQVPSAFGATEGSGMWAVLQDFLRDPGDPEATAQALEDAAAEADQG
ncbi:ABC transporter substrate-binding protein [Allonocardiopsis opalescens]|uniref:Alpha-glucoside transport system substrate-binding protein n=1 Tax=Allonocardiopsis opalescens TaxID=1144618 RepID=A0A2T0PTV6_9ACTN|nr:extracellular solute-binding protein [Allonocardiopsis opalescens]PRX92332.1 alpha-glucoside transport system substrate-binding protein [Allonocardiopsis opalescens]